MRIVHLSDIHFGTADEAVLAALRDRVREVGPGLVVVSGDFTMAGRHGEYREAASFIDGLKDGLGVPVLATPGNHDLPVYNLFERFFLPLGRYRRYLATRTVDRFAADGVALLSMNTARPWGWSLNWAHGRLSNRQVAEADAFFAGHAGPCFRALVVHHPFFVPEGMRRFRVVGNDRAMLEVMARRRVHAVLSGHLHRQQVIMTPIEADGAAHEVALVQAASAASVRHRGEPNAFFVIDTDGASFEVETQVERDGAFVAAGTRQRVAAALEA